MAMALSEFTVNHVFKELRNTGAIHDVWSIRMGLDDDGNAGDMVFDEGYTGEKDNPSYDEVETPFNEAFTKTAASKDDMRGFIAAIGNPYISIREHGYFDISFCIPFTTGKMCWTKYDRKGDVTHVKEASLDGFTYVFTVQLGKIAYPFPEADIPHPIARENVKAYVTAQTNNAPSLRPEDFTVERLFLDFENADFIADTARTIIPAGMSDSGWIDFQRLLQLYFTEDLAGSANPYVLGYAVTIPDLEKRDPAVFQPASLDYSTSFVAVDGGGLHEASPGAGATGDDKRCALNYLMMVTEPVKAKATARGEFASLIGEEDVIDKLHKYNVLGLDYGLFYEKYLLPGLDIIATELNATVADMENSKSSTEPGPINIWSESTSQRISHTGSFAVQGSVDRKSVGFQQAEIGVYVGSDSSGQGGKGTSGSFHTWKKTIHARPRADIVFQRFVITQEVLNSLKARDTPDDVLNRLGALKDRPFESMATFSKALESRLTPDQLTQYRPSIVEGAGKGCLRIDLQFDQDTDYHCEWGDSKSPVTSKKSAHTSQAGAGMYLDVYPGADGHMFVTISPYDRTVVTTTGDAWAVEDVNGKITGDFFSKLLLPNFQSALKLRLESGLKTLPEVVLPISNVYKYKAIGFIEGGPCDSVITFQSSYIPAYDLNSSAR
jgi:hypothetical protein